MFVIACPPAALAAYRSPVMISSQQLRHLLLVTVLGSSTLGCKKDADKIDPDSLSDGKKAVRWLVEKGDKENADYAAQRDKLDKAVLEAQSLIEDNHLDRAEAKLADVHWTPRSQGLLSEGDKKLIEIYDDKRKTLRGIIERKRR